jgi:hypothetical protein
MRGSTLVDGNAFRKIEGIVEGDRGSRVPACKWSITIKSPVREGILSVEWLDTRGQGAIPVDVQKTDGFIAFFPAPAVG